MPMYDFHCPNCRKVSAVFRKIIHRDRTHMCGTCGTVTCRRISAPRVVTDIPGYSCPITGKWVEGRQAHRENLAQHGCRVLETGEAEAAAAYRRKSEEALERSIDETVEREIHSMTPEKRHALAADLEHFSADITRS